MNIKKVLFAGMLLICLTARFSCASFLQTEACLKSDYIVKAKTKKQFKLTDKQYNKVKGWWTYNSSGGWDVKFTYSKVKYFDRETGEVAWTATIKKCRKKGKVYIYYIKSKNGRYEFRTNPDYPDSLEYYDNWDDENISSYYSGSSSLWKGRWRK